MTSVADLPMIELGAPVLGDAEKQALHEVIDDGWLTMGGRVRRFEQAFAEMHGTDDAIAVHSATSALQLALAAVGVGPGDEVLLPSLTFVATASVVLHAGATPVFVDIDSPERPHLSIEDARRRMTARTRAVIVMPYGGYAVDAPVWRRFADEHGVALVEDAAHAAGLPGHVARVADASAFSFFSNKNMTTAEGGMLVVADPDAREHVRLLRAHAMTASTLDRDKGHRTGYDVVDCGHNFRMDELRAALGLVQLPRLLGWNATRRELTGRYRSVLAEVLPQCRVPFEPDHPTAAHLLPVLLPPGTDRAEVAAAMRVARVQTSAHYPPVHRFSYYRDRYGDVVLPKTEEFHDRELTLPLHPRLTPGDVERVVAALAGALDPAETPETPGTPDLIGTTERKAG
ncbi:MULTISPECIES: DegT/DnrJ/EryC1/StrS family aminotransferase [unclassified Pseudonocardia]|uniref:DegT/DnrJ/EryC1/StrS family aminotransferase n=1 Tax=unclassified Pseudonocardia TaxID=2619320 RepID=UPI000A8E39D7|nr:MULTISPECIES: DegT/DnrJ/EryC1/StrS aminotransferase family protein [unclassified Pseudonocardia]